MGVEGGIEVVEHNERIIVQPFYVLFLRVVGRDLGYDIGQVLLYAGADGDVVHDDRLGDEVSAVVMVFEF